VDSGLPEIDVALKDKASLHGGAAWPTQPIRGNAEILIAHGI
jgi:hypothetical protein